jgi:SAM-dependent methyltransferase
VANSAPDREQGDGDRPHTDPPASGHWFEPLAQHLGAAYLRYSFTKGTHQEVDFLVRALDLEPGHRVLDVGCGPGRHAYALAERGISVLGIDISQRFVDVATAGAPHGAAFCRADARALTFDQEFDAAISLCQGAFGLNRTGTDLAQPVDPDAQVLAGMRRSLRPGGRLALTAFSGYFQVRWLEDADTFDPATGLNHERTVLRDEQGTEIDADLWTTCYTARELRLLATSVELDPVAVWGVSPGAYAARPPTFEHPELLLLARRH